VIDTRSALRSTLKVDVSLLTPVAGAITAIPVIAIFIFGLSVGTARTAISMAIGANLIAIVSLVGAPRLSIRLAIIDALTMGLSVFVGTVTHPYPWLHMTLLVPWCFGAGMLVIFGQTQATIGSQAIIAYVVLGRFSGTPLVALHLGLFVVIGALVEVLALVILRLPPSLRYQRGRMANGFEAVAELARSDPGRSATDVLPILDDAERALSAPSLFGRTDVRDLRAILDQARRVRLELTTMAGLRIRLARERTSHDSSGIETCLEIVAPTLVEMAVALRKGPEESRWRLALGRFEGALATLQHGFDDSALNGDVIARQCVEHLNAIGGQLRSAGKLVEELDQSDGRHVWRPSVPALRGLDFGHFQSDVAVVRGNLHRSSPAWRHAVRLAVAVPLAATVGASLSLPRSYWLPFAVAVILKPDYSTLVKRGLGRLMGTVLGATVAAVLVSELHPNLVLTTLLVALTSWMAYSTWAASFSVAIGFVTAMVLILLSTSITDTLGTALDRLIDISLGGAIAVVAYLVWPTSPRAGVREAQAALFLALRDYLEQVVTLVDGRNPDPDVIARCSRTVRLAWAKSEAAVGRSVEEPAATRVDPSEGRGLLAAALRILRAIHALRIEAERGATISTLASVNSLSSSCVDSLERLGKWFSDQLFGPVDELRPLFLDAEQALSANNAPPSISLHLDELVNALNTATHLAGLATPATSE